MSPDFRKYDLVIFDLDNTLYDENIYLFKAYEEISIHLNKKYPHLPVFRLYNFLKNKFLIDGRDFLLNHALDFFCIKNELENCLEIMRSIKFKGKIPLTGKGFSLLKEATAHTKVLVLTNGNPLQQKNKVEQLDWCNLREFIEIIYANEYAPKPSVRVFESYIKKNYSFKLSNVLMIGDGISDEEFAMRTGINFIDINNL